MRTLLGSLALLVACGSPQPAAQHPPPPLADAVDLLVGALPAGTEVPLQVVGAAPGASVYVVRGAAGTGPCPAPLGGACLGVTRPRLLGSATADAQGRATVWIRVPSGVRAGVPLTLQAVVLDRTTGAAGLSPVRVRRAMGTVEHVVIVGVDGMGGAFVDRPATPVLDGLAASGPSTLTMQNALPTSSSTNWMSMIAGSGPDVHGVTSNGWQPGDSVVPPTLFAALRAARPTAAIGVFYDWGDFGRLVEPGVANAQLSPGDERQTMATAITWITTVRPTLTFIHLDHVDHAGHASTWGSTAYDAAIEEADDLIDDLVTALHAAGMWDTTALIVSADHGGRLFSHGADTADERAIPLYLVGPGLTASTLPDLSRVWDITPTAAGLLGLPVPSAWVGRSLGGTSPDPGGTLTGRWTTDYTLIYEDVGSGAVTDVSFWAPVTLPGEVSLGSVGLARHGAPTAAALVVADDPALLRPPVSFELIWSDAGSPSVQDVSLWNPIPPEGFVCLGTVATADHGVMPDPDALRCVHHSLVHGATARFVWTDTGSRAALDGAVWACDAALGDVAPGSFLARRNASDPGGDTCRALDGARVSVP